MLWPLSTRMSVVWIKAIPVEIEEKHDQVKPKLDEWFLFCSLTIPFLIKWWEETFLWMLSFLKISVASSRCRFSKNLGHSLISNSTVRNLFKSDALLAIVCHQREVKQKCQPVSIDQEKGCEEQMYWCLRHDVGVQAIAQIDRIDVVTGERERG